MRGEVMAVMDYRTQDGIANYGFAIEFQSDKGWRVYIIFQPFNHDHDHDHDHDHSLKLPHQSTDRTGRRYVNWPSKLDSLGDAKTVAALWAELIQRYQRTQEEKRNTNKAAKRPERLERLRTDAA
jgi:hypothetical protein